MADVTIPITPTTQIPGTTPPAQDLQINLEGLTPTTEMQPETGNLKPETDLDLNLDLNLPDAPKNDERLKAEDQKNNEAKTETIVETVTEPVAEAPVIEQITEQVPVIEPVTQPVVEPVAEEVPVVEVAPVTETALPEAPKNDDRLHVEDQKSNEAPTPTTTEPIIETTTETPPVIKDIEESIPVIEAPIETIPETIPETIKPATNIEETPITAEAETELQDDMTMINNLEGQANMGGGAPDAITNPQPTATIETPKTFDLDAMLGTTTKSSVEEIQQPVQQPIPSEIPTTPQNQPVAEVINTTVLPAFTLPTATTQVPVSAISQTQIPTTKTANVKALLFVVLFAALGFTTVFILKTMYPLEFASMFNRNTTQMHASEETTGTIETITGAIEDITGSNEENTSIEENVFGELNDLGTTTEPTLPTEISRLTDYVNQGNTFIDQGKTLGNNTIIKYGLYISKKSTTFLEKIANGEEINNLSGYFAQFDKYIVQLDGLLGQTPATEAPITPNEDVVSPTPTTDDIPQVTNTTSSEPAPTASAE